MATVKEMLYKLHHYSTRDGEVVWLADWIEHCELLGEKIPWERIDARGLQLAQEMTISLGDIGIPLVYQLNDKDRTQIHISNPRVRKLRPS